LELRSRDRRFGLVLSAHQEQLLQERSAKSWPNETGGILVGCYTEQLDTAVVTRLPMAPADSISSRARFIRGLRGLQKLLTRLWDQSPEVREYYLGEWHCHPGQAPVPSPQDEAQMKAIAEDPKYRCPEPVLLIVGGSPSTGWSIAARVYPRGAEPLPLLPCEAPL
jgi:integrative and conjugative element protein (TIGR02256 family)